LGIRTWPIREEEAICTGLQERKDAGDAADKYTAEVRITLTIEDGRRFSKLIEVEFDDTDCE
jgi:hypothetical protein